MPCIMLNQHYVYYNTYLCIVEFDFSFMSMWLFLKIDCRYIWTLDFYKSVLGNIVVCEVKNRIDKSNVQMYIMCIRFSVVNKFRHTLTRVSYWCHCPAGWSLRLSRFSNVFLLKLQLGTYTCRGALWSSWCSTASNDKANDLQLIINDCKVFAYYGNQCSEERLMGFGDISEIVVIHACRHRLGANRTRYVLMVSQIRMLK